MQLELFTTTHSKTRTCAKCETEKSILDFSKCGGGYRRGVCKPCDNLRPTKKDPVQALARSAKRRASKRRAIPAWMSHEEYRRIRELYREAKTLTRETGIPHHVDHIVPITSEYVQGFHTIANLRIITAEENIAKSNRTWLNSW